MASLLEDVDGDLDENLGRGGRRVTNHSIPAKKKASASDKVAALGIKNTDMLSVRDWVTGRDHEQYSLLPAGMVSMTVTHSNLSQKMLELRFELKSTVAEVKTRLYSHHGTPAAFQRLTLRDGGVDICALDDDSKMLGYYSPSSGMELHVRDVDPHSVSRAGGLEDVSLVQKYRMSDSDYEKRKGTVREWIREQKAADPNWKPPKPPSNGAGLQSAPASADARPPTLDDAVHIKVGSRCQVSPGARRGIVGFVGLVPELAGEGVWVGVALDEPLGKHDGVVKGHRYFEAVSGHGTFVRPGNVEVGDFPENDFDDDDEL